MPETRRLESLGVHGGERTARIQKADKCNDRENKRHHGGTLLDRRETIFDVIIVGKTGRREDEQEFRQEARIEAAALRRRRVIESGGRPSPVYAGLRPATTRTAMGNRMRSS